MKKLVIFDLDGTLLNTIADLGSATNHAMKSLGYPLYNLDDYRFMVGNGISKLIERALPPEARSEAVFTRARELFLDYYGKHLTDFTRPYPGIPQLLAGLNARGIMTAVASNKYREATSRLIATFFSEIKWVAVEGENPPRPRKPSPEIVYDIMGRAGVGKESTLYVGDSGVDMSTAHNASVESVGVTWGFRPETELRETGACHIATSPADILDVALKM